MKRYAEPFIHLVFWFLLAYLAFNNLGTRLIAIKGPSGELEQFRQPWTEQIVFLSIDLSFKLLLFYALVVKLLPAYLDNRIRKNLLKVILIFSVTFLLSILINYLIIRSMEAQPPVRSTRLFSLSILLHFFTTLVAIAYSLTKEHFRVERLQKEIREEKLKTELDFLKSQLNPHFLFNTLNNLFAEANKHKNPTLSNGIAKLSQMMRYMLYESNESFVPLGKEVEALKSFVELQMLRISSSDPFELRLDLDNFSPSHKIAPLLFQPLIENAFKHGVSIEADSFVNISLVTKENHLKFSILNSKSNESRQIEHSGIGLANLKRRLELIYPDSHTFTMDENERVFGIVFTLELDRAKYLA